MTTASLITKLRAEYLETDSVRAEVARLGTQVGVRAEPWRSDGSQLIDKLHVYGKAMRELGYREGHNAYIRSLLRELGEEP